MERATETVPTGIVATETIRVWDLPTRLFHWSLVILVATSYLTVQAGEMEWHGWSGYAILTLLLFRLGWGVIGSASARFATFVRHPAQVVAHLKALRAGHPDHATTHNPLGGLAVVAMLGLLLAQAITGLMSNDDSLFRGPLARLVGGEASDRMTGLHYLIFEAILILVVVHVLAVLVYRLLGHPLIEAMVTGDKPLPVGTTAPRIAHPAAAAALLLAAAAIVYGVILLAG